MSENLDSIIETTQRLVRRAKLRLYWEVYAPTLAPGFLAIALFTLGASLGFWQWIGDPIRLIALLVTLYFVVRSVRRALLLRRPTHSDARRRIETDSGQAHRPLDVLDDRPALSAEVWPSHQKIALGQARSLRRAAPRPTLSPIDPYYLRIIAPALLIVASLYMAGFSFERLRRAITPNWQSPIRASQVSYEAWIDPPSYMGRPPIYFKDGANVAAPQGSEFVVRISGSKTAPRPRLTQGWWSRFLTPKRLGAKSFEISETMDKTAKIEFRVGLSRKTFTLNVGDDLAPEVEVIEPPKADKRDRLTLEYSLNDDFGVETLQLEMALMEEDTQAEAAFDGVSVFADISLPASRQTSVEKAKAAIDLSKTRYAGRKVIGRLVATDGAGQAGYSEPVWFIVPDKIFVEPLAKAVAEQRVIVMAGLDETYKPAPPETPQLTQEEGWNQYQPRGTEAEVIYDLHLPWDRAPAPIQRATLLIEAVTDEPAGLFKDPAVFMGLRHARSQMRHAESVAELKGLPDDLWRIALRAEFGVLGSALEEMREAEAALREGIARRAAKREIDTLFDRYNLAVDAYTEELRRKALEEGIQEGDGGGDGGGSGGSLDEIQELLKAIEEANAAGDTEGARKALARLAEVLENMQIQLSQGGGGGGGGDPSSGDMSEEEQQQLEDLADLTGKQRDLQDETEQAEREEEEDGEEQGDDSEGSDGDGSQGGDAQGLTPQELARRQEELRELLDSLGDSLASGQGESEGQEGTEPGGGETAEAEEGENGAGSEDGEQGAGGGGSEELQEQFAEGIGAAGQAMRRSEDALQDGDLEAAGDAQEEAIRALREAGEALAEAVSERGEGREGGEDGNDPLGRSDGGFDDGTESADIDNQDNATRSRELLEELRRRAAEQEREVEERQYIDRLLKRF